MSIKFEGAPNNGSPVDKIEYLNVKIFSRARVGRKPTQLLIAMFTSERLALALAFYQISTFV